MAQAAKAARPNIFKRFTGYLHDVRAEMRRVVWPTRPEVLNLSIVVITTLLIFIVMIAVFDQVVVAIINALPVAGGR